MKVRAKFYCCAKKRVKWWGDSPVQDVVELNAASGKGNEEWSAATPSGKIEMTISNQAALAAFEVGKSYFVEFALVTEGADS